ncbi:MAG: trypsin-like peptidase domain-containing protein [Planctomycetota bacterium]
MSIPETVIARVATFLLAVPSAAARAQNDTPGSAVEIIRLAQQQRTELIARLEPAVCAVMSLERAGGGSGVIFSPRGWVLTNYHVTRRNKVMKIGLPDGKFYLADVVGIDPGGDIAVMALRGKGPLEDGSWPCVELGDSDQLKLGGFAYAMGNPFLLASDLRPTVTMGIISGLKRYQKGTGPNQRILVYPDCIQVDTPINPGNSGGPLFDENGLLVGINGRIQVRDRGRVNTGVGFAVSINQIKNFLPELLAGKHAEHGTLDMNVWKLRDPNLGRGEGIFVQALFEDSVAYKAGLREGDRFLAFDGVPIRFANQVARMIGVLPAGFTVEVTHARFREDTRDYGPPLTQRVELAVMDTGSRIEERPNVPDFSERPDFEKLKAEQAERKKKQAKKIENLEDLKARMPEEYRDRLPEDWKDKLPKSWRRELRKKFKGKIPGPLEELLRKPEKERDLDREEGLFAYMDGVVEDAIEKFTTTLLRIEAGAERRFEVRVVRHEKGKSRELSRKYQLHGETLSIQEEGRSLATGEGSAELQQTLERERDLNPLLRPWSLLNRLEDSWLEGGLHVKGRVGLVFALRGPGRRAVYLDSRGYFPLGYRYRSYLERGIVDVRFFDFQGEDGVLVPRQAELYRNGELLEEWSFGNRLPPGFLSHDSGKKPAPDERIQKHLDPLFKSVVKVYGASGFATIADYASGLVVSEKGHILSWDGAMFSNERVRIVLEDGSVHEARIVTRDPKLGVILLKMDPTDEQNRPLPLVPLRFPTEARSWPPGTSVLSVGNSFRVAEFKEKLSVTLGVVVGTVHSDLRLKLRRFPFQGEVLIVDAPSNPGTQGGGLFTLDGELIGLLTRIVESSETNTQLSLVIPAHELAAFVAHWTGRRALAREIVAKKAREKKHAPVYTGIVLFETGRRRSPPAYVDRVLPGSPAARAKIRPDDLVVRVNEFPVQTCSEFRRILAEYAPGERVSLTVKRGSRIHEMSLELEERR